MAPGLHPEHVPHSRYLSMGGIQVSEVSQNLGGNGNYVGVPHVRCAWDVFADCLHLGRIVLWRGATICHMVAPSSKLGYGQWTM